MNLTKEVKSMEKLIAVAEALILLKIKVSSSERSALDYTASTNLKSLITASNR